MRFVISDWNIRSQSTVGLATLRQFGFCNGLLIAVLSLYLGQRVPSQSEIHLL